MRRETMRVLLEVLAGLSVCAAALILSRMFTWPLARDPDWGVMAGHEIMPGCFGAFYARHGSEVVLITVAHCIGDVGGSVTDGRGQSLGTWGPIAEITPCDKPGHRCLPSDMSYVVLVPDRIPWGRLDQVLMGRTGYRDLSGTRPRSCADIAVGDPMEVTGILRYRAGKVIDKARYLNDTDGDYFPCLVLTDRPVMVGDSGGPVLVNGQPAGITSRTLGGRLAFTPLAEGLEALGLTLCTTPDCDLVPPAPADPRPARGIPLAPGVTLADSTLEIRVRSRRARDPSPAPAPRLRASARPRAAIAAHAFRL